ncbi:MAG: Crp/Fnr family transcriptional regulator, partial [Reyranella sp.]|uniref:Crp/Fnr family transcriptional regulator n=1 Tax=Reyranella sp. TaxID=1929291 RepID=UPI003D134078
TLRLRPFLGALTADETRELFKDARVRHVKTNEVVFRKNDPGDSLYGVVRGRILIVAESPEGKELILNKHDAGELFGEIALLDGAGRSATAIAYEASELLYLGRDRFLAFLKLRPETMIRIIDLLCARLRRATILVEDSAFLDVAARLAKLVLTLLDDRAAHADSRSAATLRIAQKDLALMLGVSREFVTKLLAMWRDAGIVEPGRRRLTVLDISALERVVAGSYTGRPRGRR